MWRVYHVTAATGRQVQTELSFEVDLLGEETPAKKTDKLFLIHREALKKNVIADDWNRKSATSPISIAQSLLSPTVLDAIRKDIRSRTKCNSEAEDLAAVIRDEVVRAGLMR